MRECKETPREGRFLKSDKRQVRYLLYLPCVYMHIAAKLLLLPLLYCYCRPDTPTFHVGTRTEIRDLEIGFPREKEREPCDNNTLLPKTGVEGVLYGTKKSMLQKKYS